MLWFAAEHGPPHNVEASHKITGEIWELIAGRLSQGALDFGGAA